MADGQVVFEIKGDASNVNKTVKQVTSNIESESRKWDLAVDDSAQKMGKSFSLTKTVAVAAIAAIGAAVVNFGKDAIEVASNLAEVQNVVDTVFGESAGVIDKWAKKASSQFGLTELQAKKFSSTLGAMMKSSGLAGDEIVSMSTDLAGLAADMASFYNMDFETAFEKIRSGISGETMPLKQLGINMSVANLEAFALAQGLDKAFNEMSQGEQTMLRYQYLMQATADAQGDFARTSDGYANATRRVETAFETIKTKGGELLMTVIEPLTSGIAGFLESLTKEPETTVLDDFRDIDIDTADKLRQVTETYNKAQDLIRLLEEIQAQGVTIRDGSFVTFEQLFGDLSGVEANGGSVEEYLQDLGVDVTMVTQKYQVWKETLRQLTATVPSLTSVIDTQTGAIDGGTEALERNLEEWKAIQEKKIAWAAYYAKERALAEKKGELYMYEFDAGAARQAAARVRKQLEEIYGEDIVGEAIEWINSHGYANSRALINGPHLTAVSFAGLEIEDAARLVDVLEREATATADLEKQTTDYSEAEQQLADGKQELIELYGEEEDATESATAAVVDYKGKSDEAWASSLAGAKKAADAIKAVTDYYDNMRAATDSAVRSVIKGFGLIKMAGEDYRTQSTKLAAQEVETLSEYSDVWAKWGSDDASLQRMAENWESLSDTEQEAYEALVKIRNAQKEVNQGLDQYKPEGMKAGLQSQIDFMAEYLKNLETLKEWGLSDELLASLSDGSTESAEFLKGLVEGGPEAAKGVDALYSEVQEKREQFTTALTEQKLAADETYQGLVETAKEAMEGLDLGEEAANAMGSTVQGIIRGISDNVPGVQEAVGALMTALDPLTALGFTWGFGDGSFLLELGAGSYATGLDYVPRDNFPAFLHEGEGVLTAAENQIWQRFKNGNSPTTMDYDALGGVMRDNVQAGGNVYLDGRTVGHVISDMQGQSYRNLKRSGWQS
jgi:hypothetical protein